MCTIKNRSNQHKSPKYSSQHLWPLPGLTVVSWTLHRQEWMCLANEHRLFSWKEFKVVRRFRITKSLQPVRIVQRALKEGIHLHIGSYPDAVLKSFCRFAPSWGPVNITLHVLAILCLSYGKPFIEALKACYHQPACVNLELVRLMCLVMVQLGYNRLICSWKPTKPMCNRPGQIYGVYRRLYHFPRRI